MLKVLLLIPFLFVQSNEGLENELLGKWKNPETKNQFVFNIDGTVSVKGQVGPELQYTSYNIDETHSPVWIDLHFKQGGQELIFPGIIELKEDTVLRLEITAPGLPRPEKFSPFGERKGYNYKLYRVEK